MSIESVINSLKKNNYSVCYFETKEAAAMYLKESIKGENIGFGDSLTIAAMNMDEILSENNTVINPARSTSEEEFLEIAKRSIQTDVYITSLNAMTEDGILVNLDSTGNRIAGSVFGAKKVYYVVGINKIEPDLERAIWRVRNVAAPHNAHRHGYKTPCAKDGAKCYNCNSPERICNGLFIELKKTHDTEKEIVLINEELGL